MQNTPPQDQRNDDEIDLMALLGALLDGKWIIIAVTFLFAVAGVAFAILSTPIYQANALIQVEEKSGSNLAGFGELNDMFGGTSKAITEIELLKSRAVIGQAVDNLNLDIIAQPKRFPFIGNWMARRFSPMEPGEVASPFLGFSSYAWGGEVLDVFQFDVPNAYIGKSLVLRATDDTGFVLLFDDREILRGQAGEQIQQDGFRVQVSNLIARPGTEFSVRKEHRLQAINDYQTALNVSERGRDSGILNLSIEHPEPRHAQRVLSEVSRLYVRQNVERNSAEAAQSLEFLRDQLPNVRQELERYEQALNEYQITAQSVDISIETKSVLDQIVALDTRISELNLRRAELERRFTREHPTYQALVEQTQQLQRQKTELSSRIDDLPATQQELLRLSRDVAVTTEVYTGMLNRTQELDVARAGTVGNVRVIDEAEAGLRPVKPKKPLIAVLATLLGGMLGVAIVLVRHALNRGVENPDVIEQLGLPVYAAVPYSKEQLALEKPLKGKQWETHPASHLLGVNNPADLSIESLRSLRTSLHFAKLEAKNNIMMITGPSPGIGKSFVSANLAVIMAQAGQKVLLIDADMRKGYVNRMFRKPTQNGLSELLAARITSNEAIHETEVPNLHLISRGQVPPNPSELLMHANFSSLLDSVKDQYDLVIIDTPPILAVTDAAIVGRQVGMNLLVARFGVNSSKEIELSKRRFEQNDIQLKGAIFNAVVKKASAYGNYGYYNYAYTSDKT